MHNGSFSSEQPRLQIAWDATSLSILKNCPRKYEYEMLQQRRASGSAASLTFGVVLHKALEVYDAARAEDKAHEAAQKLAVQEVFRGVDEQGFDFEDGYKNPETLLRAVVWYTEEFKDNFLEPICLPGDHLALELPFQFSIEDFVAPTGEHYIFCGHIDKIARWQGSLWIVDRKTTKSDVRHNWLKGFSPNNQFSLYTLAGKICFAEEIAGVLVDGVQVGKQFARFARGHSPRTSNQLSEWLADAQHYIRQAEHFAYTGYWPQNDESCSKFGGCPFREPCSLDPSVRENILKTYDFNVWDPLNQ